MSTAGTATTNVNPMNEWLTFSTSIPDTVSAMTIIEHISSVRWRIISVLKIDKHVMRVTNLRVFRRRWSRGVLGGLTSAGSTALRRSRLILRVIKMDEILRVQERIDQHNIHSHIKLTNK